MPAERPTQSGASPEIAAVLQRNIQRLRAQREREEAQTGPGERLAGWIARFAGSMGFAYVHAAILAAWIAINLGLVDGVPRFDPTFMILANAASVEAIFLTTFVLLTQNRLSAMAEKRAALDLQINLLAEYEITRLVKLTAAIARRLGV